jgi:hypothetical protein
MTSRILRILCCVTALVCELAVNEEVSSATADITFANERTELWQIGVTVQAQGGMVNGIVATIPVPRPWPEQDVKEIRREISSNVASVQYRDLDEAARQLVIAIPRLTGTEQATAFVTLEIKKRDIVAPTETAELKVPNRVSGQLRAYLKPSPYIESRDRVIGAATREVVAGQEHAWQQVEAIYDWTREKVEYRFDTQIKGARKALDDGFGDCEELTSLFVAMCRAAKIPARAVWIPDHCYPEFYLEDSEGNGHWYPCQAAGTRAFGSMPESRPILQKGDSFRLPGQRKPVRYVQETLRAKNASAAPAVQFVRQLLDPNAADASTPASHPR